MEASDEGPQPHPTCAPRRKRYERSPIPSGERVSLTPVRVRLLAHLAENLMLSLPQLAVLTDLSEKSARRHMRELFDGGFVQVVPVARAALAPLDAPNDAGLLFGSAPNIYVPTKYALQALTDAGVIEDARRSPPDIGPRNSLFLAHELEVRDVRVWLERATRASGGTQRVLTWRVGTEAEIDLANESRPNQLSGLTAGNLTQPRRVRPDAWFSYQVPGGTMVRFVELDRGTERGGTRWREKLTGYRALLGSTLLEEVTGFKTARILVITPDVRRRDGLSSFIESEAKEGALPAALLSSFYLAERVVLTNGDLTNLHWRVPGTVPLQALVPVEFLQASAPAISK